MSSTVLFGAGAIVTFITLWGVVMSLGFSATRHQPPDDEMPTSAHASVPFIGPLLVHDAPAPDDIPSRIANV